MTITALPASVKQSKKIITRREEGLKTAMYYAMS